MKFTKQDDLSFQLEGTAEEVMKVRDELEAAWDAEDDAVKDMTALLASHDDDSTEHVTYTFDQATIGDAVDVLEASDDAEIRDAAEEARDAMESHNAAAIDAAERAASE